MIKLLIAVLSAFTFAKRDLPSTNDLCRFRTLETLIERKYQLHQGIEISDKSVRQRLQDIMTTYPDTNSNDLFDPALIYRYAIYTSFSYFDTEEDIRNNSGVILNGKPIYSGNFELLQRRQLHGFSEKKLDALYTLVRNDQQKVIVLSWQGSTDLPDYLADAQANWNLPVSDGDSSPFFNDAKCKYTGPGDFTLNDSPVYLAKGFVNALPPSNLAQVVQDLRDAKAKNPDYNIVITGHSLGGAKAYLTAMHLTLYYRDELPLHAVYTYGQPTVGSNAYNDYIATCIGPEKIVRTVSSNDIIPWVNVGDINRHSELVKEVFMPDPQTPGIIVCQGSYDTFCSAGTSCDDKSWENHSWFGGFPLNRAVKFLGQDGVFETNPNAKNPVAFKK